MTIELDPPRQSWEIGEYTDNPELPEIKQLKVVEPDFFPRADELVFIEKEVEPITIFLDTGILAFLQDKAQEIGQSYQKVIQNLLIEYVTNERQNTYEAFGHVKQKMSMPLGK